MATRTITFREAINEAMRLEMRRDPTVILFGEDVAGGAALAHMEGENKEAWGGVLGVSTGLAPEFGRNRVLDTPISESAFIGAAVGAASTGLRPIAELMFVDFFGVCFDQIFNQGAKLRYMFGGKAQVPMVIRSMIGAGVRAAAQHSECLYSIFAHIPGLKTVVPSTPYDAKGLLSSAIRDNDPVIFFEHKVLYDTEGEVPEDNYTIPIGVADIKREGKDVTIVTLGRMVHFSLEAAERLAADGIDAEVVDLRSISPMDEDAVLTSVKKTHGLVVVDEDNPRCSLATDVVALVADRAFDYLDAPCKMITAPHTPVPFSPTLEDVYIPSVDTIVSTVKSLRK
ncbi:MAG: alpha-ketoacid dehydrogenase subunit beta [Deltaproteobacteria bacterium]|nr:MAG: alpha-ketoacid dehydrogenase subunit beta [Deltaproteobacteria bacterium]